MNKTKPKQTIIYYYTFCSLVFCFFFFFVHLSCISYSYYIYIYIYKYFDCSYDMVWTHIIFSIPLLCFILFVYFFFVYFFLISYHINVSIILLIWYHVHSFFCFFFSCLVGIISYRIIVMNNKKKKKFNFFCSFNIDMIMKKNIMIMIMKKIIILLQH